jgi:hypothetical protein
LDLLLFDIKPLDVTAPESSRARRLQRNEKPGKPDCRAGDEMIGSRFPLRDVCAGLFVMFVGTFAAWEASSYPFGTLQSIGSGFFPVMLGLLAIPIGVAILWEAATRPTAGPERSKAFADSESPGLRPVAAIVAALLAFSFLIDKAGLAPAILATVVVAAFAERHVRVVGVLLLAASLVAICVGIFVFGLKMPIRIFAW